MTTQRDKTKLAIRLLLGALDEWEAEDPSYDEEAWPRVKRIIESCRESARPRFRKTARRKR